MAITVTIAITQTDTFEFDGSEFDLPENATDDQVWEAVRTTYTDAENGDPALAFDAVSEGDSTIIVTREGRKHEAATVSFVGED